MATFRPFRAIRPGAKFAEQVSCLPYDVMNRQEAKKMAEGKPRSFLHIVRSEIDLEDTTDPYSEEVYQRARLNLGGMLKDGTLIQEEKPLYYIYRQVMNGRSQTGVVGCASIDDYMGDVIKKHELTRKEKELDRINHFDACGAHTEPVFLAYRYQYRIHEIIELWVREHLPLYHFTSDDGVTHILWGVTEPEVNREIMKLFSDTDYLYIADGHHRSASSANVGLKQREKYPDYSGDEEFNYFLAVAFPDNDLLIMDYNRVVKDLNGFNAEKFLSRVGNDFTIRMASGRVKPVKKHEFGMFIEGKWYQLEAKPGSFNEDDIIASLDVSILQNNLLDPVLGIKDPRTDSRIDFIGGIRGLEELERRVYSDMKVAFSMYPTSMGDIMQVADQGKVMPPKSTWFEPKLRSGLFIHRFI